MKMNDEDFEPGCRCHWRTRERNMACALHGKEMTRVGGRWIPTRVMGGVHLHNPAPQVQVTQFEHDPGPGHPGMAFRDA